MNLKRSILQATFFLFGGFGRQLNPCRPGKSASGLRREVHPRFPRALGPNHPTARHLYASH